MKINVGKSDRIIRIIFALVLFSLFFFLEGNLKYLALIGIIPLVTAFIKFCPLYTLFGISTCKIK
ncbi:Protein of unknown function (DUF2892) [Schinkia azotoformans MEV2011]|uniref:Inner membrane protein YgaP-like transmembrane domain-containing protein n=1 Tax=Schinkia azotoformans MEV2011 TaxID=1348973 RepID=A0A072NM83_SCHAZ|nr:DUF2892 domain-containing protein [Schinkia azotoformans]KEF38769.1 Protein of unknown function (DUF2892) [Schinkia azotoformans MEV2011]MEC1697006.1 DUF2892 domain-containing protein [Schinkia azotoformans]MEC1718045.1 DUF2892 domain-containing protein [Schinkia azotoformans]MEC1727019.1 DUF2892 domain-containing protein [Schinkia azotoformans]MEC1743502.1 DUF2892 domain-containing protein [Schinkia azotoformans]